MAIDINTGLGPLTHGGRRTGEQNNISDAGSSSRPQLGDNESNANDSVSISKDAATLRNVQSQLGTQDSFDEARVDEIKQAISEGRYPIDSRRLAEKFLQLETQLNP